MFSHTLAFLKGVAHQMCDLMHTALRCVTRILELSDECEREAELQQMEESQESQ